ncbi:MAG: hypothetical protein ACRD09_13300 [Vicinamibacterales bacterium]
MAPGQAPAPLRAPALPAASEVIARYVRAIGGRDAVLRHASLRAVGSFSMPAQGITGTVERVAARPDRFLEKVSMPGVGEMQLGYDGSVGWMVTAVTGPMVLTGKQLEQLRQDAEFDASLHDPAGYRTLETVDRVEFEGRPAYKLRALRTNGDEDFEFYDVDTGLLIGSIVTRESPLGTMKATNVMGDYRAFGGLQIPTRQIQRVMGMEQVVTITSVEFGGVDPSTFAPPASIRALVK